MKNIKTHLLVMTLITMSTQVMGSTYKEIINYKFTYSDEANNLFSINIELCSRNRTKNKNIVNILTKLISYLNKPNSTEVNPSTTKKSLMRTLDPKQRKALELFKDYEAVTSKQIGDLFRFKPRTNSALCKKWVENGFLEIANPAPKSRTYRLAKKFDPLLAP
jgi:hypothetical protein